MVAFASPGAQQKVSLFHNLQLKFSKRRPSSIEPEQREKSVHMLKRCSTCRKGVSIDQYNLQQCTHVSCVYSVYCASIDGQDWRL